MDLVAALGADRGLLCVVGAGGKKSTLYALAERLDRAVVTATVRIPPFDGRVAALHLTDDPVAAVRETDDWPVGVVPAREDDRYLGYEPARVDELAAAGVADVVLVKADGARTRWFKAPGDDEPRLPRTADTVVPIASVRVVGRRLDGEHVHRPDRVAALTDLEPGGIIEPDDVAAVLAHAEGGHKGVPAGAAVVPVLNMVDDDGLEATAREIADAVLARSDVPRVVLTCLLDADPVVAVVER